MAEQSIDWVRTEVQMCLMGTKDLRKLIKFARRELAERVEERWAYKERLSGAFAGMANVMAGAAWAMACRESLRRSKDHEPAFGVRAQSGEMWLPVELLKACRLDIKEQGWSALTAPNAQHVAGQYRARRQNKPEDYNQPMPAMQFAVKLARRTAVSAFDGNFDLSDIPPSRSQA